MKKLILLLAAGSIAVNVGAQERQVPILQGPGVPTGARQVNLTALHNEIITKHMAPASGRASKTTTLSTGRWFDYSVLQDLNLTAQRALGGSDYLFGYGDVMWKDTVCLEYYTSGPGYINLTSMGTILQPQAGGFDDAAIWDPILGAGNYIKVRPSDSYTVDSFILPSDYYPGSKATTTTDTIRVCFVKGSGGSQATDDIFGGVHTTGGHYGSISFLDVQWDSITSCGTSSSSSPTAEYMDILIANTDTNSLTDHVVPYLMVQNGVGGGIAHKGVIKYKDGTILSGTAMPYSVGVGQYIACTYTFISGDPATHGAGKLAAWPGDTLLGAIAPFDRYNNFRPIVNYWESAVDPASFMGGSLPTPDYPTFDPADYNEGLFNKNYSSGLATGGGKYDYSPQWGWSSTGGGAYYWQFPEVSFHIVCTSCVPVPENVAPVSSVNGVKAYPNPAAEELNISYSLTKVSDISVSLTNMVGQVVATQKMSNVAAGKVVFNTTTLPAGVYEYTLTANGDRTTGQVAIAH
jgi:type IX secretion system substrate protein